MSADGHFSLFTGHVYKGHYLSKKRENKIKKSTESWKCGSVGEEEGRVSRSSMSSLLGCLRFVVFTVFCFFPRFRHKESWKRGVSDER